MKRPISAEHAARRQSGISLVLVLFAVLCLSFLTVVFFSLASNDRSSTAAYTNSLRVEELGTGGLEVVIKELRKEISDSTRSIADVPTGEGDPVYVPREPAFLLPERTATDSTGNLLKTSANNRPLYTGGGATLVGSDSSSATPSGNGRLVSVDRWNRPALGEFDGSTVPVPTWIYITRQGPAAPDFSTAADPASAGFVQGRIAFAIYDVGNTLDINVAGYPGTVSQTDAGRKGSPALARLQAFGLTDQQVESVMAFRNPGSRSTYMDYLKNTDGHKSFTQTVNGDNRFISRQEFIRFARREGFAEKLPMLGVFSREKNAPTFAPDVPTGVNPNLATARHGGSGRLLFEKRFPLSKLALLADPEENADEIQEFFGLEYNQSARTFSYVGRGSTPQSRIKSLGDIGSEATYRRPDFFETLKAAISEGSLGQSAGYTASAPDQESADSQIIRIGASIIDQYDTDYIPTAINFNDGSSVPIWGVEDLPYFNKLQYIGQNTNQGVFGNGEGNTRNNATNAVPEDYAFRWAVELWNPHVQKLPLTTTPGPNIRVALGPEGALARVDIYPNPTATETPDKKFGTPKPISAAETSNEFNIATGYGRNGAGTPATYYRNFFDPRQVFFGEINATRMPRDQNYTSAVLNILTPIHVDLFVRGPDGFLHHYFRSWAVSGAPLKMTNNSNHVSSYMVSDPRTNRMGLFDADWRPNTSTTGSPSYPSTISVASRYAWPIRISPSLSPAESVASTGGVSATEGYSGGTVYPGLLFENTAAATRFTDPDGKARIGDGGFSPGGAGQVPTAQLNPNPAANPPATASNLTRPKRLDRAFRSVAELGYVFRDAAWKTLNFSSVDSGDAALLDVFSMEDAEVRAGAASLNARRPEIWSAFLEGSIRQDDDSGTVLSATQGRELADAIVSYLNSNPDKPLADLSEFVTVLSNSSNLPASGFGGAANRALKTHREAAIRALSGNLQSRTWNLMIDLVAQTGRFPKGANSSNQFMVEGERRYWLHLAIDRYTGEIVDELLEVVQE